MLVEDGVLVERDGRLEPIEAVDSLRVPDTVQAVLAARLDRLGEDELAVLQRASVIGQVFWWGAMADLSPPEDVGEVAGRLQALVRKGLIKPDARTFAGEDGFRFGHILIRDAAYDSMPKRLRAELHERFAGWAEDHAGEGAELDEIIGHHLEQAYGFRVELGPRGEEEDRLAGRAADRLLRAGRRALGRGDIHAARTLLERAAALLLPGDVRRLELAPELGLVLTASGALSRAEEVLTGVIEHGDGVPQSVVLAARIERVALRLRSDPRGGWEEDLALVENALPGLEAAADLDRRGHRAVARGWFHARPCPRALGRAGRGRRGGASPRATPRTGRGRSLAGGGDRRPDRLRCLVRAAPRARRHRALRLAARVGAGRPLHGGVLPPLDRLPRRARRAGSTRRVSSSRRQPPRTRSSARGSTPSPRRRSAARTSSCLRVTTPQPSPRFETATRRSATSAKSAIAPRSRRCSPARCTRAATRRRPTISRARSRRPRPSRTSGRRRSTASPAHGSSSDAGALDEAERVAREALAIVEPTDLLDLRGDVLLELAVVLRSGSRADEARECIEAGIALYEAKGNAVAVERARAQLELTATTA